MKHRTLNSFLNSLIILTTLFAQVFTVIGVTPAHAAEGAWSSANSMGTARYVFSNTGVTLQNGKAFVVGGGNFSIFNSTELYDPGTNSWSAGASMTTARAYHTVTLLANGKVLAVGGQDGSSNLSSAELYDPGANTWSSAGSMSTSRVNHTATLLPNGKVLVVGGSNLSSAELYDPGTNTWSSASSMVTARSSHTATLLTNGKVLVAGGSGALSSAELYDPGSNSWSSANSLTIGRDTHTATLLQNGKVLVAGGRDGTNNGTSSAELYDPATNSWSAAASMGMGRLMATATLLQNGKVLVAGGAASLWSPTNTTELYDPTANTWTASGSMATARHFHVATLLQNGDVLVYGGHNGGGAVASAELYDGPVGTAPDTTAPTVTAFTAPSSSGSLDISISSFTASDDTAVTGYKITESATPPGAGDAGWSGSAPTTYTVGADGNYILYPWAKDAAGNVSAVFGSPASVTVAQTGDITSGLSAYYAFENNTNDSSGNGYNGTASNVTYVTGQVGQAVQFNNSDSKVEVPALADHLPGGNTSRSVAFWVNKTSVGDDGNMVAWGGNANGQRFSVLHAGNGLVCLIGQYYDFCSSTTIPTSSWAHVVVTYDGSNLRFYLNGSLGSTVAAGAFNTDASQMLRMGVNIAGREDEFFGGSLDEVRIYNRALSAMDVTDLYAYSPSDNTAPIVNSFTATSPSSSLNISISSFAASDDIAVTGYKITESATPPGAGDAGWSASAPTTYTVGADGNYTLYPWAKDAAGNVSAVFGSPASVTVATDTTVPETTIDSHPADPNNDNTPSFTFSGNDGAGSGVASFQCKMDGGSFAVCTSPFTSTSLADGSHTFYVKAIDNAANEDASPASYTWTLDATGPNTTIDSQPANPDSDNTPSFTFSGNDGAGVGVASFQCLMDGGVFEACTSPFTSTPLADGSHTFYVQAVDALSNGDASPASYTWTVDTIAPNTTIDSQPANTDGDTTPTFTFSGNDGTGSGVASFQCRMDGGSYATCTSPFTSTTLLDGSHTFEVYAIDNLTFADASPASYTWTVDSTVPSVSVFTAPAFSGSLNISLTAFTASDDTAVSGYKVTETATVPGAGDAGWSASAPNSYAVGANGSYNLYPWVKDTAGNVSAVFGSPVTVSVDTTAPVVDSLTAASTATTLNISITSFTASDNAGVTGYMISESATPPAAGDAGWSASAPASYAVSADGNYTLYPWAKDETGNVSAVFGSPASVTVEVDVTAPVVDTFTAPSSSNTLSVSITAFTASDAVGVTGYMITESATPPAAGDVGWSSSAPTSHTVGSYGIYTLYPWAKDANGNVSAVFGSPITVTVDGAAPMVNTFTAPSSRKTFNISITDFSASDNIAVSGYMITTSATPPVAGDAGWSASAPSSYTVGANGNYTLYPWAKDANGNVSAVFGSPMTVSVDTIAPVVNGYDGPSKTGDKTFPVSMFAFDNVAVTGYKFTQSSTPPGLAGAGWSVTPPTSYTVGAFGTYTLYPWAKDAAGNVSAVVAIPMTVRVVNDITPPNTTINTKPPTYYGASATFTFGGTDNVTLPEELTFLCKLDGGSFAPCSSPVTYNNMAGGWHTFYVSAMDSSDNVDGSPASYSWSVDDIVKPNTYYTYTPSWTGSSATFGFTGKDNYTAPQNLAFQCKLDGGDFEPCSNPKTFTGLTAGKHTLRVKAVDAHGNMDATPELVTWTVDLTEPETTIVSQPTNPATSSATFTFTGTDNTAVPGTPYFQCKLDDNAYNTCVSPINLTGLSTGSHKFYVRAVDVVENKDASPATYTWLADGVAPVIKVASKPVDSPNNSATFKFSATDDLTVAGDLKLLCKLDNGSFVACSSPTTYSNLSVGLHTFTFRAKDALNNTAEWSYAWRVVSSMTLASMPVPDGWILEANENANAGGQINSDATTLRVGDDALDRQYRSIVYFNTSGLPANAVITSVKLLLKPQSTVGTDPFTTHGALRVEIQPFYFGGPPLEPVDFQIAAQYMIGTVNPTLSDGYYVSNFNNMSAANSLIVKGPNSGARTSFRLAFANDDDDDMSADYLALFSGDAAAADRPQLVIEYYIP